MPTKLLQKFLNLESASGIILFSVAVLALVWANSPLASFYVQFIEASAFWVNDGLMALFFLVVGLELKRAFLEGQLSHPKQILLPLIAAAGGMLIPAFIYIWVNSAMPHLLKGWATPVATDIAFALGVLSLFGKRIPAQLKLFLLALAIFDDLGAIIIIVFYFTKDLSWLFLGLALGCVFLLNFFNRFSIYSLYPYLLVGFLLWIALLESGIHPTIAGVLLAFAIPSDKRKGDYSPLHQLEQALHPWVAYFIMPLFALINAGFPLAGFSLQSLTQEIVLGITLGLFLGKQLGVFGFSWLLIRLKLAKLPAKSTWLSFYGVSIICGVGFTMSLFLGTLAFANDNDYLVQVRLGVIMGSLLSSLAGVVVLLIAFARKRSNVFD